MKEAKYEFVQYGQSFVFNPDEGPKKFGEYKLNGKTRYKNYGRELKNGKGMTGGRVFLKQIEQAQMSCMERMNAAIHSPL